MKNNKIKLVIAVLLMISVLGAVSYGAFFVSRIQEKDNRLLSGCFSTSFTDSASINMSKALPMSDTDGLKTNPYTFTISNTCSVNAEYYVILDVKTNSFSDNYISYSYDGKIVNVLNTATQNTSFTVPEGYTNSYILTSGTLRNSRTISYDIRIWLNDSADYASITNKTWQASIRVISAPSTNQAHPDAVIAYTYNGEPTTTPYSTYAAGLVTKDYIAKVSCTDGVTGIMDSNGDIVLSNFTGSTECTVNFEKYPIYCVDENDSKMNCPSPLPIGQRIAIGNDDNTQYFRYIRTTNTADTTHTYNECGTEKKIACTDADSRNTLKNNQIRMLAEYNLKRTVDEQRDDSKNNSKHYINLNALQDKTKDTSIYSYNAVRFNIAESNTYSDSEMKSYIDEYANRLNNLYFNKNVFEGSGITYEEIISLGCSYTNSNACDESVSWLYQTAFWTASPEKTNYGLYIYAVTADNSFGLGYYDNNSRGGIRPIISFDASLIK